MDNCCNVCTIKTKRLFYNRKEKRTFLRVIFNMSNTVNNIHCLDEKARFETVPFSLIDYNEDNDYSKEKIVELAESIQQNGLLHNIVLSKKENGRYKILAGERRTRAIAYLREQNPDSWQDTEALVYEGLSPRQEEIIMDASNLHSRGNGGSEEQLRKATARYYKNIKEEYGLTDKEAMKAATETYSGSGNTIRTNVKIEENLHPGFTEALDAGELAKGDASVIADMDAQEQEKLYSAFQDEDNEEDRSALVRQAVTDQTEKKKEKKKKKAEAKKSKAKKEEEPEVTVSNTSPAEMARNNYLEKIKGVLETLKDLNNPDSVAQIKRLDDSLEDDQEDQAIFPVVLNISMEAIALKNAIAQADGDFDTGIDPVYGHRMGNKGEEGAV